MKCLYCGKRAEYIVSGNSCCEDHAKCIEIAGDYKERECKHPSRACANQVEEYWLGKMLMLCCSKVRQHDCPASARWLSGAKETDASP